MYVCVRERERESVPASVCVCECVCVCVCVRVCGGNECVVYVYVEDVSVWWGCVEGVSVWSVLVWMEGMSVCGGYECERVCGGWMCGEKV